MNFNFENISNVETFNELKAALQSNFDKLLNKGYLYKGDMGETPQIVNRPLVESIDTEGNVREWSALGKSIIEAIFKDIEKYKEYYKDGEVNIDALITKLTTDGKLDGLNGATYPWWCADGNSDYPIYPATYFVYIDSTPNDIRNNDDAWKDNSCILIPAAVEYSDYRDDATAEELEPTVTYHKNHIYPSFYFDPNAGSTGAWCWKINDVETGIPASVANDDGSVLGHMFIFEKREKIDEEGKWVYYYKAGVDAVNGWMTRQEMMNAKLRYPINGDIGFTVEEVVVNNEETNDSTVSTATTTSINSINTLQIYTFFENAGDAENGGAWGLGGNLISFGENFYEALWNFINEDSKVKIAKGKIILSTNSGNHCIFVKKGDSPMLVLMPLSGTVDPTEKDDFVPTETWDTAELQLNYPKTTISGAAAIDSLTVSNGIIANSIEIKTPDEKENLSINSDGNINTPGTIASKSISCDEISANIFTVDKDSNEIIIGSGPSRVNILSDNFNVTDKYIDAKLPFSSSNNIKISNPTNSNYNIQIHATDKIENVRKNLNALSSTYTHTSACILGGYSQISEPSVEGALNNGKRKTATITVNYRSDDYTVPNKMESISFAMLSSLGITINVNGKNISNSWPYLSGGAIEIKIMADNNDIVGRRQVIIPENKGGNFGTDPVTKYCTIYCSFTSSELATMSKKIIDNKNTYKKIYITAQARFDLATNKGTFGMKETIYTAGTSCYLQACNSNSTGASIWSSVAHPSGSSNIILTVNTVRLNSVSSEDTKTVHICSDGILIGNASNRAAVLCIDDKNNVFNIKYYRPSGSSADVINVLSIDDNKKYSSDVFALKSEIPKSTT